MATDIPICIKTECSNQASFNKYFPDSDGGQYWTMCDDCFNEQEGLVKCDYCYNYRFDYKMEQLDNGKLRCCECHYKMEEQVLTEEIDLDRSLYPKGLDWTFDKPPLGSEYVCVYIIKKKEE